MNPTIYSDQTVTPLTASSLMPDFDWLQGIVEGLPDGIMILSDRGEVLYQNSRAYRISQQLAQSSSAVHPLIWQRCQTLMSNRNQTREQPLIIEDEIKTGEAVDIRIRVRWLDPGWMERPRLLVTLEDQYQSAQFRAIAEALKYHLTDRETQVWLLKRLGLSYKAIAAKLHIAEDTVKKHIKSIHARRDAVEWA